MLSSQIEVTTLNEKITDVLNRFRVAAEKYSTYLWEIGYSGGKDSTIVVHLALQYILEALKKNWPIPSKICILYSDTLLDIPIVRKVALKTLEAINRFAKETGISGIVEAHALKPQVGEDFFSCIIDKGYPVPHHRFRWCIPRLKIRPARRFIAKALSEGTYKGLLMISGIRRNESAERNRILNQRKQEIYSDYRGYVTFSPILDWTLEDVWHFLYSQKPIWGGSYTELIEAYSLADSFNFMCAGECMLAPTARFGCWVCTVVREDKTLKNIIRSTNDEELNILYNIKEEIRRVSSNIRRYRNIDERTGKPRSLNEDGREKIIWLLAKTIVKATSGLEGYLENPDFREKLKKWLMKYKKKHPNARYVRKALKKIEEYDENTPNYSKF
ncbi:MAG: phosphoadenosine phosphosulfate reductase domain-containing protein [Candidatus Njordarchaeales archaeon]